MTCCHHILLPLQLPCEVTFPSGGAGLVAVGTMARGWRVSDESAFEVVVHERREPPVEKLAVLSPVPFTTTSGEGVWLFPSAAPSGARCDEHAPSFRFIRSSDISTADVPNRHPQTPYTPLPRLTAFHYMLAIAGCANGIVCPPLSGFTTTALLSSLSARVRTVGGATLGQTNSWSRAGVAGQRIRTN